MTITAPGVTPTQAAARFLADAGITAIPARADGSKAPALGTWKQYQQQSPTGEELAQWFGAGHNGIGVVTGPISGNLELAELEGRAADQLPELAALAEATGLGDLWRKVNTGWVERSPSGGIHWFYRLPEQPPGNTKLASRPSTPEELAANPGQKVQVLAETRGTGGFVVVAPSNGTTHPTGRPWTVIVGGPDTIPTLSMEEREQFHALLGTLHREPPSAPETPHPSPFAPGQRDTPAARQDGALRPGDDYENKVDWRDILEPLGWTLAFQKGNNERLWARPGKSDGVSASTGYNADRDRIWVWSTSTELPTNEPINKFRAYSLFHHGGDNSKAAAELRRAGYGDPLPAPAPPGAAAATQPDSTAAKPENPTAAEKIVRLAVDGYILGISDKQELFALPRTGPRIVRMLRGGKNSLRAELSKQYYDTHHKVAGAQALTDALMVLEGMAQDTTPQLLHQRVAATEDATWYDLGDGTGEAVRITGGGWDVRADAPVLFRRTELTAPAARPTRGGNINELFTLLNVTAQDRPLLLAYLVSVFFEDIPHPVMGIAGEQGSAKSTAARIVTDLVDASTVPLRKVSRDGDSWSTAAAGSWVVTVDNISTVSDWLSDALCRASTGDGDVRRKLYTDGGLAVTSFRRCVILTGIDLGGLRGDLTERLLKIDLDRIPPERRREEKEILNRWEEAQPRIFGALLDLTAEVRRRLPTVTLQRKGRMADFHHIIAAVDAALGTSGESRYLDQAETLAAESLAADPFITALMQYGMPFTGTGTELLDQLRPDVTKVWSGQGWPKNARKVTELLMRNAPALRSAGWEVEHESNRKGVTVWRLQAPPRGGVSRPEGAGQVPVSAGQDNRQTGTLTGAYIPANTPNAGNAGHAGQENGQSLSNNTGDTSANAGHAGLLPHSGPSVRTEKLIESPPTSLKPLI